MQELIALSTGPFSLPFQPRCVGGSSRVSGLMIVSFSLLLMIVFTGCGFDTLSRMSGSFPHCNPTGTRLAQRFLGSASFLAPLYWKLPNSQPDGAFLWRTMMSIWISDRLRIERLVDS